jgi:nicotinamidase-related amidase
MKKIGLLLLLSIIISCKSTTDFNGPTDGVAIDIYTNPQKALLVMDMQNDALGKNAKEPIANSAEDLIETVNTIIDDYFLKGYIIIYIKTEYSKESFIKGTFGAEIHPSVRIIPTIEPIIFVKNKSDAFTNSDFENYLIINQVNELFIVGLMAEYCVYNTSVGALNRNYIVNYIENAVGAKKIRNLEQIKEKLKNKGANIIKY